MSYCQMLYLITPKRLQKTPNILFVLLTLFCYDHAYAMTSDQRDVVIKNVQKAMLETSPVKNVLKQTQDYIKRKINPPAWTTTAIAVGASAALKGKISTSKFKNLRLKGESWQIKPDVEYRFNGATSGSMDFNLDF